MYKNYQFLLILFTILITIFSAIYVKDFRIDASSDTLVAKNDKDFQYYKYYQNIFPTKNTLVIAVESENEIDLKLLKINF